MNTSVELSVNPNQDIHNASMALTGLFGLHRARIIDLRVLGPGTVPSDPFAVVMNTIAQGRVRRVAIDLHDRSDIFFGEVLQYCDTYFKRSFYPADVLSLKENVRHKVLPFGLNYPCGGAQLMLHGARWYGAPCIRQALRDAAVRRRWSHQVNLLKRFVSLPHSKDFERRPADPVEPIVLFQTRVWEPDDVGPDNADEVNDQRAGLVRKLRKAFGNRFAGGLVPTKLAVDNYPDAVTDQSCRHGAYVAMSNRAMIGVYSRGLNHSIAFKLPEYLAASKAIVSDGFRNQLPAPLQEGVNYLAYTDPDECVERCAELIADPERTHAMRLANHRYYLEEVEPKAHMLNVIRRACGHGIETSPVARQ